MLIECDIFLNDGTVIESVHERKVEDASDQAVNVLNKYVDAVRTLIDEDGGNT